MRQFLGVQFFCHENGLHVILIQFLMSTFDRQKAGQLFIGIVAVYSIYSIAGLLQQKCIKTKYINDQTGQYQSNDQPYAPLFFVGLFSWVLGTIVSLFNYSKAQCFVIPWTHGVKCGAAVVISTIAYTYAIHLTNFPVVMMIRSCNILSVALVGVMFTGVKDTALKLGNNRIIVALLVTAGMIIFKAYDPNQTGEQHKTQVLGIVLMLVSLLADGFLPDFQAVVKQRFKPHPTVLLAEVNKWTTILTFVFLVLTGHFLPWWQFTITHTDYLVDLVVTGLLCFVGQIFIYRLVKQFKQHIVPFIITTRKIFTVVLSIAYFGHKYNYWQVLGIVLVLGASLFEFLAAIGSDFTQKKSDNLPEVEQGKKVKLN